MKWKLLGIAVLLGNCTRLNPAFDLVQEGGEESEDQGTEAIAEESGEQGSGNVDLSSSLVCEYQPAEGLDLRFGDPDDFEGDDCPESLDVWAHLVESHDDEAVVETCAAGCAKCEGDQPLSISPLTFTGSLDLIPTTCLHIQAGVSLGDSQDRCKWGSLSVYDGIGGTPYLIAVTHANPPTPMGVATLAGLIPDPVEMVSCECDDVGQSHDCCYQAESPPTFLAYPWGDDLLWPGDHAAIELPNDGDFDHVFEVFQAERLNACESSGRSLSWAVSVDLD